MQSVVLLLGARQMTKDIPDLLQTRSTDYDPPPSHVCVNLYLLCSQHHIFFYKKILLIYCCSFLFLVHLVSKHVLFRSSRNPLKCWPSH